jgi:hypothetical protein
MSPKDTNILNALNLLTLLFRSKKQKSPKLSEEETHTLTVTEQLLAKADINLPVFLNTLTTLADKGYLVAVGIHDDEFHEKIREGFKEESYNQALEEISKAGIDKLTVQQKTVIAQAFQKMMPANAQVDLDDFINDDISIKEILDDARNVYKDHKDGEVAKILLMPFRDIDVLLTKMNDGKSFDEIQDSEIWYDEKNLEFRIGDIKILTKYQGKPNVEHYVLILIKDSLNDGVIWYDDIEQRSARSLKDSLLKFINKDQRLQDVFTVHTNRLEFSKEAFK